MLLVGSDDGVYRIASDTETPPHETTKILDSGRVMRLRQFEEVPGVFAATKTGLYRSPDGSEWQRLDVPRENVYAIGTAPDGDRLYAGTRPAHLYATAIPDSAGTAATGWDLDWNELTGFQELPSREEWRLPRHEDLAQVRDVRADPGSSNRIVTGVEVGGVHVSSDGGTTWTDRSDGVHNDVHELHVVEGETYVAATGDGLYQTSDAGRSWERLDRSVIQSYFRRAFSIDDDIYASAALSNSSTWDDPDAEPALFGYRKSADSLEVLELPADDETVTGMTALDGDLVVATHRGSLFVQTEGGWDEYGEFPVTGPLTGRYTPVTASDE